MNKVKYWGKHYLENISIIFIVAILLMFFIATGAVEVSGGMSDLILESLGLLPYYLCFAASFSVLMVGVGYFQSYFPVLVSMNVTRKSVINGIMVCLLCVILTVLLISAMIWYFIPINDTKLNIQMLMLFGGIQFIAASFSLLGGYVIARWKKIGTIVMVCMSLLVGGSVGASVSIFGDVGIVELFTDLVEKFQFTWVLVLGMVVYLIVGIFIRLSTSKLEIRI